MSFLLNLPLSKLLENKSFQHYFLNFVTMGLLDGLSGQRIWTCSGSQLDFKKSIRSLKIGYSRIYYIRLSQKIIQRSSFNLCLLEISKFLEKPLYEVQYEMKFSPFIPTELWVDQELVTYYWFYRIWGYTILILQ